MITGNLPKYRFGIALAGVVMSLAVSGCGTAASSASTVPDVAASQVEASSTIPTESPLNEYLGLVLGFGLSDDEQRSHFIARNIQQEELVAQCMTNLGFEYAIYIDRFPIPEPAMVRNLDSRDWVSQWGYGLLAMPDGPGQLTPTLEGFGNFSESDPNQAIFDTLSEPEQIQWYNALWGGLEHDDDGNPTDFTSGCMDIAWQETQEVTPASIFQSDEFAPLFNAWMEMTWTLHAEITEADRDWATCMADSGYTGFSRQLDPQATITDEFFRIMETQHGIEAAREYMEGQAFTDNETASQWVADNFEWLDFRLQETWEELASLTQHEINVALADLDCRISVDFQSRRSAHEFEVETQFVNDHRTALAALRDAAEQRGISWVD